MPDPASLYALYYEIVRSGIDPFSDLAKECKSAKSQVNLKLLLILVALFFNLLITNPTFF